MWVEKVQSRQRHKWMYGKVSFVLCHGGCWVTPPHSWFQFILAATSLCLLTTGILGFGSDLLLDRTVVAYQILYGFTGLVSVVATTLGRLFCMLNFSVSGTHSRWPSELCTYSLWGNHWKSHQNFGVVTCFSFGEISAHAFHHVWFYVVCSLYGLKIRGMRCWLLIKFIPSHALCLCLLGDDVNWYGLGFQWIMWWWWCYCPLSSWINHLLKVLTRQTFL